MIVDWAGSVCSGITLSEHIVDDSVVPSSARFTRNPNDFHCSSVTSRHGLNAGWLCCSGLNFPISSASPTVRLAKESCFPASVVLASVPESPLSEPCDCAVPDGCGSPEADCGSTDVGKAQLLSSTMLAVARTIRACLNIMITLRSYSGRTRAWIPAPSGLRKSREHSNPPVHHWVTAPSGRIPVRPFPSTVWQSSPPGAHT